MTSFRSRRAGLGTLSLVVALVLGLPSETLAKKDRDAARVDGRVFSQQDEPVEDVVVRVVGGEPASVEATTDRDGEFELRVVPPESGKVTVSFAHPDFAFYENEIELSPREERNVEVRLVGVDVQAKQQAVAAYNSAVAALEDSDDREKALELFGRAAELDPQLAEAHLALADLHLAADRLDEALASVTLFRSMRPENEEARRIEFEIHRRRGDVDSAERVAAEGGETDADIQSSLAVELYNRGVELLQENKSAEAYAEFRKAHEADPGLTAALEALATIAYDLERYDDALRWADQLLAPSEAEASEGAELPEPSERGLRTRFLVFDARGDMASAETAFEAYRRVAPEAAADLLYRRADLDFRDGRTEAARAALKRVLEIAPEHARAHYTMGLVLAGTDPSAARESLERFLELAPEDPEAGMARDMLGHL